MAFSSATVQSGIRSAAESHKSGGFMYAIAFDMDTESLQQLYGSTSYNNAYADIRKLLTQEHGFTWQQGSVYFGGETVNAVTCVLAVSMRLDHHCRQQSKRSYCQIGPSRESWRRLFRRHRPCSTSSQQKFSVSRLGYSETDRDIFSVLPKVHAVH